MTQTPPPAPFAGPSLEQTIKILTSESPKLPLLLGSGSPEAVIQLKGGNYEVAPLKMTPETQAAAAKARAANPQGIWMPENEWAYMKPGKAILSSRTKSEFVEELKKIWRPEWGAK